MNTSLTRNAVSYALVAALAFGGGLLFANHGLASNVIAKVPFIGNNLDTTPDQSADLSSFWQAWNALNAEYVVTHASSTLPTTVAKVQGAIQGLAASYGDPYTVYFPPAQAKAFSETIAGNFGGVGMEIDVKNSVLTVVSPLKDTPAALAGVKSGDQILSINGTTTEGMSTDQAVAAIRGPKGSTVDFLMLRGGGKPFEVKMVRATIQVPESDDGPLKNAPSVYKIALYEFTANSADLFNQAFARFKASGSKRLVIDLRGNPGGYLDAAVTIASHFLPQGATVVTEDYGGKQPSDIQTSTGTDDVPTGTKLVVLVDGGSASASEILAGALQDNKAATIIGTQSFGKGSVQQVFDLGGGSLKVTVARWLTPAGHWIMGNGITPDIVVPFATTTPAGVDPQLDRAAAYLTTGK